MESRRRTWNSSIWSVAHSQTKPSKQHNTRVVCLLFAKGAKGWNIQPNSVLWEENGNASLPQVHHSRKNLEGWSATRSV